MNIGKRVRNAFYISMGFIIFGVVFLIYGMVKYGWFSAPSAIGFDFAVMGAAMLAGTLVRYSINKNNPESRRNFEAAAKDERNIMIENKARGLAFLTYIVCAFIALILCVLKNMPKEAEIIGYNLSGIVFLYFLYNIIQHKKY